MALFRALALALENAVAPETEVEWLAASELALEKRLEVALAWLPRFDQERATDIQFEWAPD